MICHGELARLKPQVQHLTLFYLFMSLGGFLGSAFVAFIAQSLFDQFLEFPLAIISVFVLLALGTYSLPSTGKKKQTWLISTNIILAICFSGGLFFLNSLYVKTNVASDRNFYGILSVKDVEINNKVQRRLVDGTTSHGTQSLEKGEEKVAQSYFRKTTGVALLLEQFSKQRKKENNEQEFNVGIVGLGAGTLAAYGNDGDNYTFYELNPAVISAAKTYFSYLNDSAANIDLILGDGRVSLQKQLDSSGSQEFDTIVIDAFSGDSIPQHLLTREALTLYFQHLKADGVLAIHISNSHLNLAPLARGLADVLDKEIIYVQTNADKESEHNVRWVMLTNNQEFLDNVSVKMYRSAWQAEDAMKGTDTVWTDEHSDLLSVLK